MFTDTNAGGVAPDDFRRAAADADVLLAVELTSPASVAAVALAAGGRTVFLAFDSAAQLQSLIRLKDYRAEDGGILQRVAENAPWTQTAKDRCACVDTCDCYDKFVMALTTGHDAMCSSCHYKPLVPVPQGTATVREGPVEARQS